MTWILAAVAYGFFGVGVGGFVFLNSLINGKTWPAALPAAIVGATFWPVVLWVEFRK